VTNSGLGGLQFAAFGITAASLDQADFAVVSGGTCAVAVALQTGQSCTVLVRFNPAGVGPRSGILRFWVNTVAGYVDVSLTGEGLDPCAGGCL
jgi:hypothetical protein